MAGKTKTITLGDVIAALEDIRRYTNNVETALRYLDPETPITLTARGPAKRRRVSKSAAKVKAMAAKKPEKTGDETGRLSEGVVPKTLSKC